MKELFEARAALFQFAATQNGLIVFATASVIMTGLVVWRAIAMHLNSRRRISMQPLDMAIWAVLPAWPAFILLTFYGWQSAASP